MRNNSITLIFNCQYFSENLLKIIFLRDEKMDKIQKRNTMKINIYTIASEAGVSIATVSRVLNNSPSVSEKTKEKVFR